MAMEHQEVLRTLEEQIQPKHTALVIVDVQNDFVHPQGLYGTWAEKGETTSFFPGAGHLWEAYPLIPRALKGLESLLQAARDAGALRVFVRAIYNPEYISPPMRVLFEEHGLYGLQCQAGTFGADFYGDIRPDGSSHEVVVSKHRLSGFWGTDLDLVLRSNGVKTVLMTGTATSGCVESTSRDAFFADYYTVTVEDCCADRGQDRQDFSMRAMGWGFGHVTSSDEIRRIWSFKGP
jgi:ureidoacrylate peracid hydrolase